MKEGIKIAISGRSGCGNSTVSRKVAEALGLKLINYTFRNMAEDYGMSMAELAARAREDERWDRELDARQVEMARDGNCVLGSRLAVWVLEDADLRVFLTAPIEVRAERIHAREGGSLERVKAHTTQRDREDHQRYLDIYGIDNDDYAHQVDLVVDTTGGDADWVAGRIVAAARSLA